MQDKTGSKTINGQRNSGSRERKDTRIPSLLVAVDHPMRISGFGEFTGLCVKSDTYVGPEELDILRMALLDSALIDHPTRVTTRDGTMKIVLRVPTEILPGPLFGRTSFLHIRCPIERGNHSRVLRAMAAAGLIRGHKSTKKVTNVRDIRSARPKTSVAR